MPQTTPSANPACPPMLLNRVRAAIRTKHYSRSTENRVGSVYDVEVPYEDTCGSLYCSVLAQNQNISAK